VLDEKLTKLLELDARYADRLEQPLSVACKLEWAIKARVDTALETWMVSQGERHGFAICKDQYQQLKLQASGYSWHALSKRTGQRTRSGFSAVNFTGELTVTDVDTFKHALFYGIGRSKAFGCGLLMVRRA